ncbi:hypothetical protein FSP39_007518 [Pinctada imbricata]|uniref:Uncharacterized protein n=1 Tax=Pinctada imbricata TaxID=66713 RepID=A0AA88Y1P5_PINIB|nr:hypothetical protein FSP39_007518 [Pinctada imbricata]
MSTTKKSNEIQTLSQELRRQLAIALDGFCFEAALHSVKLRPIKVKNSNAADSRGGIDFSKAYCDVSVGSKRVFLLGDIFQRGLDIIVDYLEENKVPENKQEQYVLGKLVSFINTCSYDPISTEDLESISETDLTTLYINHLFGKLSTSSRYVISKNSDEKQKDECPCGRPNCKLTGTYGETCLGNVEVWHGHLGIIINNEVIIETVEEESESSDSLSPVDTKIKSSTLSRNSRLIAETVVFSFLQKQTNPERDHFLTPCVGISNCEMIVLFYDSEHDVLLESSRIPILDQSEHGQSNRLNFAAIVVSWFVVNYKYLCSGLTDDMISTYKADFLLQARDKIHVYETKLTLGNVDMSSNKPNKTHSSEEVATSLYLYKRHNKLSKIIFNKCNYDSSDDSN